MLSAATSMRYQRNSQITSHSHLVISGHVLHYLYSLLMNTCLALEGRHEKDLIMRGFYERNIKKLGYRTVPGKDARLVIESEFAQPHYCGFIFDLHKDVRLPGCFFDGRRMRMNLREGSLLVPVKDGRSFITALQTYPRVRDEVPRWFDSDGLPRGVRAARQPHFARPWLAREYRGVVITEHTLAADLHAWTNDEPAVAVNGLLPDVFARCLRGFLPEVSTVAFSYELPDVELLRALESRGFQVYGKSQWEVA